MNSSFVGTDIKPFNEFWMNCKYNALFSIASYYDPNNKYASYVNHYSFEHTNNYKDPSFKLPIIKHAEFSEMLPNFTYSIENCHFENEENFLEELKQMIRQGQLVFLSVNLYSWIPGSFCYQRYHWSHFSLIKGYDEVNNCYLVLDDDMNGYNEFVVSEDTVVKCFRSSDYFTDRENWPYPIVKLQLHQPLLPYEVTLQTVQDHARRLVLDIEQFTIDDLWKFDEESELLSNHLDYSVIGVEYFYNRHIANVKLFKHLHKHKKINDELFETMLHHAKNLENGWQTIRNNLMKVKAKLKKSRNVPRDSIIAEAKLLFENEKLMWQLLVEAKSEN
ncbi:hypothetical protein [Paenibacillus chitinolyticus]|uniref:hypothetical protein n=1 Tax=Paenibacillus chitinolyticus TaxID=79263 RepID=UPI003645EC32